MKKLLLIVLTICLSSILNAQESSEELISNSFQLPNTGKAIKATYDFNSYVTPWYGVIGLRSNTAKYTQPTSTAKGNTTYFEISSVRFSDKGYGDFGIPFAGYVLKLLVTGKLNDDHPVGEVPFIYIKAGFDILKIKNAKIGLGASAQSIFMRLPNSLIGYSALKYGALSPLIYAKINFKSILVAPIFEYHVVTWTDNKDISRSGFSLGTYVVIPIGSSLGININPYFESGKFKSSSTQFENMKSSNLGIKIGLMSKI